MTRRSWCLLLILLAGISTLAWSGQRLSAASGDRSAAEATLAALTADAQELVGLRAGEQAVGAGARPDQDVIAQVSAALGDAGLAAERLTDLAQVSDSVVSPNAVGGGLLYREQTVRLTLDPVTLPELGAFLISWRADQRAWTVRQIELSHGSRAEEATFRAAIQIAAVYVDEQESPPAAREARRGGE